MLGEKREECNENLEESICDINHDVLDSNGNIMMYKRRKINSSVTRGKIRKDQSKEPLPMKLRALPRSFWQQPNQPARQAPGGICPDLPLLGKEEVTNINNNTSCLPTGVKSPSMPPPEITTPANTDLLFSLFAVVDKRQKSLIRRGRPRKPVASQGVRDTDPCLVSTVNEPPLVTTNKGREVAHCGNYSNLLAELVVRL